MPGMYGWTGRKKALEELEGWGGEDLPSDTRVVLAEEVPGVDLPPRTVVTYAPGAEPYRPEAEPRVVEVGDSPEDEALRAARNEDIDAFNARAREMAFRQLVGGITRTGVPEAVTPLGTAEKDMRARLQQQRADALRELEMQNEAKRAAAYDSSVRFQQERELGRSKRAEDEGTLRRSKEQRLAEDRDAERLLRERALDLKERALNKPPKAPKADKPKEFDESGMPYGWQLAPDSKATRQQREKFAGTVQSAEKMRGLTAQMRKLLASTGGGRYLPGEAKTKVSQLATLIQLEAKNVAELGALSGPDMALMNAVAANPTAIDSLVKDIPSLLDGLDSWSENSIQASASTVGAQRKGSGAAAAPTAAMSDEDKAALEWANANPNDPRATEIKKRLGR